MTCTEVGSAILSDVLHRVYAWVNKEGENWLSHASRCEQCSHALTDGIITQAEFDLVKAYYERLDLWHYVGD